MWTIFEYVGSILRLILGCPENTLLRFFNCMRLLGHFFEVLHEKDSLLRSFLCDFDHFGVCGVDSTTDSGLFRKYIFEIFQFNELFWPFL